MIMSGPAPKNSKMSVDEFIKWAMGRPEGERYELAAGEVVAMVPERSIHAKTKGRVYRRLVEAVEAAGLPCTAYPDGMAVMVDEETIYVPDVMVRCGEDLPDDAVFVTDPVIVVEVLSPSTSAVDTGNKFTDYFRLASVRHYLLIRPDKRTVVHHERDAAGDISTRIVHDGTVRLDPPGLDLADIFERAP
jgi:Uma2 family endonuclease